MSAPRLWSLLPVLALAGCVNLDRPRAYACRGDGGGECPAGWRCGLEGFCRDPDEGGPFLCDRDGGVDYCAEGWFCTVEGRCRSRDAGGPFACRRLNPDGGADPKGGAPNDCGHPGWWCGAGGECLELGVARDYLCAGDPDCEGGWRCGPEGRCVPLREDALSPQSFGMVGAPKLVSPRVDATGATHVAVGAPLGEQPDGGRYPQVTLVAFGDGGLSVFARYDPAPHDEEVLDVGAVAVLRGQNAVQGIEQLGFIDDRAFALRRLADAGLSFEIANIGLGPELTPFRLVAPVHGSSALRTSNRVWGPAVAFSSFEFAVQGREQVLFVIPWPYESEKLPMPGLSTQKASAAFDLALFAGEPWFGELRGALVASTYRGLFVVSDRKGELLDGGWRGLGGEWAPNDVCGPALPPGVRSIEHLALRTYGPNVLGTHTRVVLTDGGQQSGLGVYAMRVNEHLDFDAAGAGSFPRLLLDGGCEGPADNLVALLGLCDNGCPENHALIDFQPLAFGTSDGGVMGALETRCEAQGDEAGRQSSYVLYPGSSLLGSRCVRQLTREESAELRFVNDTSNSARVAYAERGRGMIRWGTTESTAVPLLLDRPPAALLEQADGGDYLVAGPGFVGLPQPGVGIVPAFSESLPQGALNAVDRYPNWLVADDGVFELHQLRPVDEQGRQRAVTGRQLAGTSRQGSIGLQPTRGVVLETATGGRELLVSSFDSVFSADVSGAFDGGAVGHPLELRSVPFARLPIESLAASSPLDGGAWAVAYAKSQAGLFEVRAETPTRWRSFDVRLDEEPLSVFSTGRHARAGFVSGRVVALPSRLELAPPLAPDLQPATSFASVCGQPWALARGGLFALDAAPGAPVGQWRSVALDASGLPHLGNSTPGDLFERGRLVYQGGRLWLFLADGTTFAAAVSCPDGAR